VVRTLTQTRVRRPPSWAHGRRGARSQRDGRRVERARARRLPIASGVTLGLAIGLGGIGAPLLGLLADAQGLEAALLVAGLLPLIGVAATLTLPGDGARATARAVAR
jgi:hypothetical protein